MRYGDIRDMYDEAIATGLIDQVKPYTTTLMFHMHKPIYLSRGTQMNIKITKKEDLELFEAFVMMKRRRMSENGSEA